MCVCVPVLKKVKHRLVENMSSGTADALGLSRAILCNGETPSGPVGLNRSEGAACDCGGRHEALAGWLVTERFAGSIPGSS